jgi:O-antigen/teichoic acid export membrane protein
MLVRAVKGMSVVSLGALIAKALSMVSFYFIGKYLTDAQIGEYASVLGLIGIVFSYQNGGIEPLIVQRKAHKKDLINGYLSYAVLINFAFLLVALVFSMVRYRNSWTNLFLAACLLFNSLASPGFLYLRTKYIEAERFASSAVLDCWTGIVQYLALIIAVVVFEHEISFGIGFMFLAVFGFYLMARNIRFRMPKKHQFLVIFQNSKWLMAGSFLTGVILNAPYLIIGFFEAPSVVGSFYFVNQSVYSLNILMGKPIQSVILPLLSNDQTRTEDMNRKFSRMVNGIGVIVISVCAVSALFMGDVIQLIWGGKWLDVAPIFHMSLMAVSVRIMNVFYWAYTQSIGNWSLRPRILMIEASVLTTCLLLSCFYSNDLLQISKYVYSVLIGTSIAAQFFMSRTYHLNTSLLSGIQLLVLWGMYFEKI